MHVVPSELIGAGAIVQLNKTDYEVLNDEE
jgi:hypothetical protein